MAFTEETERHWLQTKQTTARGQKADKTVGQLSQQLDVTNND